MSRERAEVQRVLAQALTFVHQAEEELGADMEGQNSAADSEAAAFVRETRALFQRRSTAETNHRRGGRKYKGRVRGDIWKSNLFLLQKHNEDFVPPPLEMARLTRNGLGVPKHEQPGSTERYGSKSIIQRKWNFSRFEKFVQDSFPEAPLHLTGFTFAKAEKGRRLKKLAATTIHDLELEIGKGKIFVVPGRDLPLPVQTPVLDVEVREESVQRVADVTNQPEFQLLSLTTEAATATPPPSPFAYVNTGTPTIQIHQSHSEEKELDLKQGFSELELLVEDEICISIRREKILEDVQAIYSKTDILNKRLRVKFMDEEGDDFGGLTKDLFSSFWNKAFTEWFKGEDALVPCLPINQFSEAPGIFSVVGKVLSHMCQLIHCIPPRFCRSTLLSIVFNTSTIDSGILLDDFLLHVTTAERSLLWKALKDFTAVSAPEKQDLLNFFSVHGMYTLPSTSNFKSQLLLVAQNELIIKPMYLNTFIRQSIPQVHMAIFWSQLDTDLISYLYWKEMPTVDRVLQCLTTCEPDLRPEEDVVYYYLRDFIKSLYLDDMCKFLQFVTGSPLLPYDGIKVSFNRLSGTQRRPIAHTCSNIIEIPVTYTSVQEFRREMRSVLYSDEAFTMTML
ncbi:uncharacterized protein LOC120531381 isoform X11 [Polypterus senegalus]|uniref:uncharacterized protein LOC120531381 isoform X10 n=1 Tax=Polypterus senegalus TaxID=55291 RepID=UPI0019647FA4|nr:uncharacterized protein LOC120531381 isoform X10 [Polypterus senegalus]XP_039612779.1 uncharacterized protein LOC120531381 isoform X11 [Polypterus senegalus]